MNSNIKYLFSLLVMLPAVFIINSCIEIPEPRRPWPDEINFNILAEQRIKRINADRPAKVKIVMLGNSITEQGGNWNARLGREDVFNCGQGGYSTQQFSWLLDSCVFDSKPEYCFITGGINDLSIGVPVGRIVENLKFLISLIMEQDIKVVFQSTILQSNNSKNNPDVKEINRSLKAFCRSRSIPYIDLNRKLSGIGGLKEEYTSDGTHLNEQGYDVWSEILRKWIKKNI